MCRLCARALDEVRGGRQRLPRLDRCVSALPAAALAGLLADFDASVRAAAEAVFELVTFEVLDCDRALPAADFAEALADFEPRVFAAADATRGLVRSDLAMVGLLLGGEQGWAGAPVRCRANRGSQRAQLAASTMTALAALLLSRSASAWAGSVEL